MLFMPTNITPDSSWGVGNGTVDATNPLTVSWQVNGNSAMTAYQIVIYKNDAASTQLYSTGKVTSGNLPFYGTNYAGETEFFSHTIPAENLSASGIVNGGEYKLIITQWWSNNQSVTQASASAFITRATPTLSVNAITSPIATRSYTFTGSYAQAQGDAMNWVRWQIAYNNDTVHPFYDTGEIYGTAEIKVVYDGFFTGNTYAVRLTAQTVNGVDADTGWVAFDVAYATSEMTGLVYAKKACKKSAVHVSWPNLFVVQGEADGPYTIDNGVLTLPNGSSVTWDKQNEDPISYTPPWSILWRGKLLSGDATLFDITLAGGKITLKYVAATRTLTLYNGESVMKSIPGVDGATVLNIILTENKLYVRREWYTGGLHPSATLYPANNLYPSDDDTLTVNTENYGVTYTQTAIQAVKIDGTLQCDFMQILKGEASTATITSFIDNNAYTPENDAQTYFLADFTDGLDAGNLSIGGDNVVGFAVYRMTGGSTTLQHVADVPISADGLLDYAACSQTTYQYYIFPIGEATYVTNPLISNAVAPCLWDWAILECEKVTGVNYYTVVSEFLFGKNLSSGDISNNNTPNVMENFTAYPTVQLSPSLFQSGTLSSLIGIIDYENGNGYYDTIAMRNAIWALSTTRNDLFLKSRKGDLLKIRIDGEITMQTMDNTRQQAQTASVPWVEVGSTNGVSIVAIE